MAAQHPADFVGGAKRAMRLLRVTDQPHLPDGGADNGAVVCYGGFENGAQCPLVYRFDDFCTPFGALGDRF